MATLEQEISRLYVDTTSIDEDDDEDEEDYNNYEEESSITRRATCSRGKIWFLGKILDPRASWIQEWNQVFLLVCATGLFVDPLFFYALSISEACMCLFVDGWFAITVTVLRCMTDSLHLWNMWLQLKINNAVNADERSRPHNTSSRTLAMRYLKAKKGFFLDLFVILPIPQELGILKIAKSLTDARKSEKSQQRQAKPRASRFGISDFEPRRSSRERSVVSSYRDDIDVELPSMRKRSKFNSSWTRYILGRSLLQFHQGTEVKHNSDRMGNS